MIRFRNTPYFVTDCGSVYREGSSIPLKPDSSNKKGYKRVTLSVNGRTKRYLVHRMVAEIFIPNPNAYPHVNHIDNNPSNNHVKNLEWVTHSQNMIHCHSQDRCSNLIASNEAKRINDLKAAEDLSRKFKDCFDHTYTKNRRRFIVNKCLNCDDKIEFRSDSSLLFFAKVLCESCIKDEDIVCSYMRI